MSKLSVILICWLCCQYMVYDSVGDISSDAARVPFQIILDLTSNGHTTTHALDKIFSPDLCSPACKALVRDGHDGEADARIQGIYHAGINVETVANLNSPYTFVATTNATTANNEIILLPLIVQATLVKLTTPVPRRSSHITRPARNNVAKMYNNRGGYDVGHIIAFQNGGTTDLFNFVGQLPALNRGPYKTIENVINDWINYGGTAKETIVITYRGTIPDEFTVKLRLYNADGTLHADLLDIILKNN